jgi:hypothetical protein
MRPFTVVYCVCNLVQRVEKLERAAAAASMFLPMMMRILFSTDKHYQKQTLGP